MKQIEDSRFQRYVINVCVPFPIILQQAGIKNVSYEGNIYCPFHANYNSPSAKLYKGARGDSIYCYAERRTYRPADVCLKGMISQSIQSVFEKIWGQLDVTTQQGLCVSFGQPVEILPDKWKNNASVLDAFKRGDISFYEHLARVAELIL